MLCWEFSSSELWVRLPCVLIFSKGMVHSSSYLTFDSRQSLCLSSSLSLEKEEEINGWRQNPAAMIKGE